VTDGKAFYVQVFHTLSTELLARVIILYCRLSVENKRTQHTQYVACVESGLSADHSHITY